MHNKCLRKCIWKKTDNYSATTEHALVSVSTRLYFAQVTCIYDNVTTLFRVARWCTGQGIGLVTFSCGFDSQP